jgi:hypothetical protein
VNAAIAQVYEPIEYVKLEFWHSLRIPYNNLEIKLMVYYGNKEDKIKVIAKSSPTYDDKRFQYSKIDTSFLIDRGEFIKIIDLIKSISASDIYSYSTMGADGSSCGISFGNFQNLISYNVWSPDINTKERRLENFMIAFKAIIEIAKIDSEKIFN